ncbi:unnamed protein product [Euphydryas editha]|uniref:FP protein C-terminal domain-containing protein n=1 Tax=Euphydryas editha TaxID=104508 RepID=A0AAU9U1X9_EUPED|nr:unnamed protein product [Euphydryas editha]
MFTCASCREQHTDGPPCSVCKLPYDFSCSGVTEVGFRKLGERKNTWRCPRCKSCLSPSPASSSPQTSQLDRMQEQLNNIALQLKPLARLIEDVKYIREELNSLKDSQEMLHHLFNSLSGKMDNLESRVSKVEKKLLRMCLFCKLMLPKCIKSWKFGIAKTLAKERNFKYIWVKHSKIMGRKSDTSPIFFIRNEKDLLKID